MAFYGHYNHRAGFTWECDHSKEDAPTALGPISNIPALARGGDPGIGPIGDVQLLGSMNDMRVYNDGVADDDTGMSIGMLLLRDRVEFIILGLTCGIWSV